MRFDRILATMLIAICLVVAVGTWIVRPADRTANALWLAGGGPAQVAVFDLYGTISDGLPEGGWGEHGVNSSRVIALLRLAAKDNVKAIVLRINSPGGTAAASDAIYRELMRIRKLGKVKIVASMGDVAASGAYYVASAAHRIVALPGTTTGSIGVIAHALNVQRAMGKLGVADVTFKSGAHKDLLSPFREVDPTERAILQQMVDDIYLQFLNAVVAGRPGLPLAKLKPLADGRVYTGSRALKLGLVDALGCYSDALLLAAKLAGIKGEPTTKNYTTQTLLESVFKLESRLGFNFELGSLSAGSHLNKVPLAMLE